MLRWAQDNCGATASESVLKVLLHIHNKQIEDNRNTLLLKPIMKLITFATLIGTVSAFTAPFGVSTARTSTVVNAEDAKINNMIDLENPKVVNTETLEAGEKKVYCRCWKSGTFPLCDAAHVNHNKETGDNVGPLIVSCAKAE
jgi:CDGSH-type Zn-finger protein